MTEQRNSVDVKVNKKCRGCESWLVAVSPSVERSVQNHGILAEYQTYLDEISSIFASAGTRQEITI